MTCRDLLAACLLPTPMTRGHRPRGGVLVPKGEMLLPRDTTIPLTWEQTAMGLPGPLLTLNQQAEKGAAVLDGVGHPDYHGEMGLLLPVGTEQNRTEYEHAWITRGSSGHLVGLPVPRTEVSGKQPPSSCSC